MRVHTFKPDYRFLKSSPSPLYGGYYSLMRGSEGNILLKVFGKTTQEVEANSEFIQMLLDNYFESKPPAPQPNWVIRSIDSYYYQSGRNYDTYVEVTTLINLETQELKDIERSVTILEREEHTLPNWAKGITKRNRKLEKF